MLIANAADRANVNPQTLRYYERRGLLKPSGRRPSGYREYTPQDVQIVRFVKRAQELGFSLQDVQELLRLRRPRPGQREAVRRVAEVHMADLDEKIRDMQRMRNALANLVHLCHENGTPYCPILDAFETGEDVETGRR